MSQNEKAIIEGAERRRSPSFPLIPIDEAIDRTRQIYNADRRAFTDFTTLVSHMGYTVKKKGGRSGRTVAALKQYGLLDERNKHFRISDTAWKILEMEEGTPERAQLIKDAAFSPPMIRKVFKHFGIPLPSDATLRNYLLFQEKFNPDGARDFIRVLRRTAELVNPEPKDYEEGEESEWSEIPPVGGKLMQRQPLVNQEQRGSGAGIPAPRSIGQERPQFASPPYDENQMQFPLYLKGQVAVIRIPAVMSKSEFELLKKQIENSLIIMEATAVLKFERGDLVKVIVEDIHKNQVGVIDGFNNRTMDMVGRVDLYLVRFPGDTTETALYADHDLELVRH